MVGIANSLRLSVYFICEPEKFNIPAAQKGNFDEYQTKSKKTICPRSMSTQCDTKTSRDSITTVLW